MYLDNKIITLNTAYATRLNGTFNSNVVFNFRNILSEDDSFVRAYISVMNAQFPNSFYIISLSNNVLYYTYTTTTLRTITLPVGNYNATSLIEEMTSLFTLNTTPITTTIDADTGKLTFSAPSNFSIYLSPFSSVLGLFRETTNTVIAFPTVSVSGVIVALSPLNLLGPKQILIKSSQLAISSFDSKTLGINDTLACIVNGVAPFGLIQYEMTNELNKNLLINPNIAQIDIRITDENDNLYDFNNINWTMTLCLTVERNDVITITPNLLPYVKDLEEPKKDKKSKELDPVDEELKLLESGV